MFEVRNKASLQFGSDKDKKYTVYSVQKGNGSLASMTLFLLHIHGKWEWVNADYYVPVTKE